MFSPITYLIKKVYKDDFDVVQHKLQNIYPAAVRASENPSSKLICNMLISAEDHRFRFHFGFDIVAIFRAIRNRILYKKIEGASTIEQQLVRVLTNDFDKTLRRKIKEVCLAVAIKKVIPRKYVPIIYLLVAYYGTNINGLMQIAAKLNFVNLDVITLENAAEIVARIKYPEQQKLSNKRSQQILRRKEHLLNLYSKHNKQKIFSIYGRYF